jgi:hypothetical protein
MAKQINNETNDYRKRAKESKKKEKRKLKHIIKQNEKTEGEKKKTYYNTIQNENEKREIV